MKRRVVREGYINRELTSTKTHVSEIKLGMFISKLDKPWEETPFLMQGFHIEALEDIDIIAKYCEYVWIDETKEKWVPPTERAILDSSKKPYKGIENTTSAEDEHANAANIYREARSITRSLLDDIRLGGGINSEQASQVVGNCVDSVLKNPDALGWMSRMREDDEYTTEHCINVCILSISLGRQLKFSEQELFNIGMCGLLHDVGKIKVPDNILNKPGPLTEKELKMMRAHPVHGRNLLIGSPNIYQGAIDVAYSHHERIDGQGYPRRLKAASISKYSKIIAIVDAFDAMTSKRCYAPAMENTKALRIIYKDRGTHFDDELAIKFIQTVGLYPPGTLVEMISGAIGIVLSTNHSHNHLPSVLMILDKDKKPIPNKIVKLKEINTGKLSKDFLIKKAHKDGEFGIQLKGYRERIISLNS